ncbi:MAG TPA: two-component regulator propeller domain-containing protein, partial [Chitinophagaceae bacterium]|nr:two-component regulator propeller domain-containing protein [Chitinophagaceae bacterium]
MNLRYLLFLCLLPAFVSGQQLNEKNFDRYTTDCGLSHNYVTAIMQDSTGYVWISTASGVNRFNGTRFVQFHSSTDSLSMASEEVAGMTWLDKYRLAVFTTGLHIIDTKTGKTRNLFIPYHDSRYQFKFNMIMRALGDANGNIYVLSRSGFYHYDKNYNLVSRFDYYEEEDVPLQHFFFGRDLFEMDEKRLLIGSIDGLYVYDKPTKKIRKMVPQDCPALANMVTYPNDYTRFFQAGPYELFIMKSSGDSIFYVNTIRNKIVGSRLPFKAEPEEFHYRSRLLKLNDTSFYLTGHKAGFYKLGFSPATGIIKLSPEKYFQSHLCTGLLKDKEGHLWIATNRGVYRENAQKAIVQLARLPQAIENTYPDSRVDDIYVLGDKVYAGTRDAGLFIFDKKTMELQKRLPLNYAGNPSSVRAITATDRGTLMFGTEGPLMLFDAASQREKALIPPKWREGHWTSDLYKDRTGKVWISSYYIYRYDPV